MNKFKYIILYGLLAINITAKANDHKNPYYQEESKSKKAWEIGIGGTLQQLNRVYFSNFQKADIGYNYDIKLRHAYGVEIYT